MDVFSNIINALDAPSAIANTSGCILSHNASFATLNLSSSTSLVGTNLKDLWDTSTTGALAEFLQSVCASTPSDLPDPLLGTSLMAKAIYTDEDNLILCQGTTPKADDALLHFFLEHIDLGFWDYDTRNDLFVVSDAWREMRGFEPDEDINNLEHDWLDDVHPEDQQTLRHILERQLLGDTSSFDIQYRRRHMKTREWIWILCRAIVIATDDEGRPLRVVGTDTDITELKQDEAKLAQLNNKIQLAIDASGIGIWEFDPVTSRVHWDDRLLGIYGLEPGQNDRSDVSWNTFIHPDDAEETISYAERCVHTKSDVKHDFRIVRPDGETRHIRTMARYLEHSGADTKLIGVNIDVTEDVRRTKELEETRQQLEYDSRHDALTGLANRRLLDETVTAARQDTNAPEMCVMHLDLDRFKDINDTFGHRAGDAVLVHVAQTLRQILGASGLICRFGGDEFAVFFEQAPPKGTLVQLAEQILSALKAPFVYEGFTCSLGISIGSATGPDKEAIFAQADIALYAAKDAGRACYRAYSVRSDTRANARLRRRQDLVDALTDNRIECWYQPQFDTTSLTIVGAEALARLRISESEVLAPDDFLPLAVETGLLSDIEEFIFQRVLANQTTWAKAGLDYPTISVNLSQQRLADTALVGKISGQMEAHHAIALELLETAFLDDPTSPAHRTLNELRKLGLSLELDDFGSGHASIVAMLAVGPERIKIDQRLTKHLASRPEVTATLQALANIARIHKLGVVLEGIETQEQLDATREIDCDALQGFALSAPKTADDFAAMLGEHGDHSLRKA